MASLLDSKSLCMDFICAVYAMSRTTASLASGSTQPHLRKPDIAAPWEPAGIKSSKCQGFLACLVCSYLRVRTCRCRSSPCRNNDTSSCYITLAWVGAERNPDGSSVAHETSRPGATSPDLTSHSSPSVDVGDTWRAEDRDKNKFIMCIISSLCLVHTDEPTIQW